MSSCNSAKHYETQCNTQCNTPRNVAIYSDSCILGRLRLSILKSTKIFLPASTKRRKLQRCMVRCTARHWNYANADKGTVASLQSAKFFCGRRPLPFGGSHLRLPSGPAGIRTTTGSLSALARPTPYQLSHRSRLESAVGEGFLNAARLKSDVHCAEFNICGSLQEHLFSWRRFRQSLVLTSVVQLGCRALSK